MPTFSRPLPVINLNNDFGANRSNVSWADGAAPGSVRVSIGDDFTIGTTGNKYIIDKLRVWVTGNKTGASDADTFPFTSLSLFGGKVNTPDTSTAGIEAIIDSQTVIGSSHISVKRVSYTGGVDYQGGSGSYYTIWQVDFTDLKWLVDGGTLYQFFVNGEPQEEYNSNFYTGPFLLSSNAALSGNTQQGADEFFRELKSDGTTFTAVGTWNSLEGGTLGSYKEDGGSGAGGWDKTSNVNMEVWAHFENASGHSSKNAAKATGDVFMGSPSQQINFNVFDGQAKGSVEYWNYDYPGLLHYTANVLCANVNRDTKEARFMFQIPEGWSGLTGLYVVAYVKDGGTPGTDGDLYGHSATVDLGTATTWCESDSFVGSPYLITGGNLVVHK